MIENKQNGIENSKNIVVFKSSIFNVSYKRILPYFFHIKELFLENAYKKLSILRNRSAFLIKNFLKGIITKLENDKKWKDKVYVIKRIFTNLKKRRFKIINRSRGRVGYSAKKFVSFYLELLKNDGKKS